MRIPYESQVDDFNEVAGFVYLEEGYLVFDYDILKLGIVKEVHAVVKAERGVIDDVRVKRGLLSDRLLIETHSLELLKELPGRHASEIELKVKRKYRKDLAAFVERVLRWVDGEPL